MAVSESGVYPPGFRYVCGEGIEAEVIIDTLAEKDACSTFFFYLKPYQSLSTYLLLCLTGCFFRFGKNRLECVLGLHL